MNMFEQHKNDSIYTYYLENSKDKIFNGLLKDFEDINVET